MTKKLIHIALAPNLQAADVLQALAFLIWPGRWLQWRQGKARQKLREKFRDWGSFEGAWPVGAGREALYLAIKALDLPAGSEVILQAFTCQVVVNAIKWNGLVPVFADLDPKSMNISLSNIKAKFTDKTKAVIIQHTFGIPTPDTMEISQFTKEKRVYLIEDCAHALGAKITEQKMVGTVGDLAIFSLGRSKVISCVNGGVVVCNNQQIVPSIAKLWQDLPEASLFWTWQTLNHFIITWLAKKLYHVGVLGKLLLVWSQKLKLINLEVTAAEKQAQPNTPLARKLPNALAQIALGQLNELDQINQKRQILAQEYYHALHKAAPKALLYAPNPEHFPGACWLRYPLLVKNPEQILRRAKDSNIVLGDWYAVEVAPRDVKAEASGYQSGMAPMAEKACLQVINLPTITSLNKADVNKIVKIIADEKIIAD